MHLIHGLKNPLAGLQNYMSARGSAANSGEEADWEQARISTNGSTTAYNLFLFGGQPDQRFTLDRATNLVEFVWTTGAPLEIFDGSGTLYYLETVSGTNLPPIEYYRTTLTP